MEIGGSMFSGYSNRNRGQNTGNVNLAWDIWELHNARFDWGNNINSGTGNSHTLFNTATAAATTTMAETTSSTHPEAMRFCHGRSLNHHREYYQQHSLYVAGGSQLHPDPHLMCLKLGKRQYFEDTNPVGYRQVAGCKRGKPYYNNNNSVGGRGNGHAGPSSSFSSSPAAAAVLMVPRCQVEGCHVALTNAKDYHRRHKVCEMHSKAPKVIVLGLEQRFCQQCSRFHVVSEFDDSKRSCRRRLAGHNERRRKTSHDSVARNTSQDELIAGRFQQLMSPTGRALSLLSSKTDSWVCASDLSSRSSAALRELIAEHRAGILAKQLNLEQLLHQQTMEDLGELQPVSNSFTTYQQRMLAEPNGWDRFHDTSTHVTLDLMQASSPAFGLLSPRGKTKEEESECSKLWNALEGAHAI